MTPLKGLICKSQHCVTASSLLPPGSQTASDILLGWYIVTTLYFIIVSSLNLLREFCCLEFCENWSKLISLLLRVHASSPAHGAELIFFFPLCTELSFQTGQHTAHLNVDRKVQVRPRFSPYLCQRRLHRVQIRVEFDPDCRSLSD